MINNYQVYCGRRHQHCCMRFIQYLWKATSIQVSMHAYLLGFVCIRVVIFGFSGCWLHTSSSDCSCSGVTREKYFFITAVYHYRNYSWYKLCERKHFASL